MDTKIKTVVDGKIKEYDILLKFTSNDTNKKYVFYTDKLQDKIFISYYTIDKDLYVLTPIKNQEEIDMCMQILNDIKDYK